MGQNELMGKEILETGISLEFDYLSESDKSSILFDLATNIQPDDNQINNVFKVINNVENESERHNISHSFIIGLKDNKEQQKCLIVILENCDECLDFIRYFSNNRVWNRIKGKIKE